MSTVPAIAPTVPVPDSRPTTVPVSARSVSRSLVTIGGTADSRAPGTRMASIAASMAALDPAASPAPRTTKGVAATTTPETASRGPRARSGGDRVGRPATRPGPGGDGGERDADDERARLEGEAEVGGDEAQGDDLDDEHRGARAEDQHAGGHRTEGRTAHRSGVRGAVGRVP